MVFSGRVVHGDFWIGGNKLAFDVVGQFPGCVDLERSGLLVGDDFETDGFGAA